VDEFEFIGISGGEAIALHKPQGHVFRFKVDGTVGWRSMTLTRQERGEFATDDPDRHVDAATFFTAASLAGGGVPRDVAPSRSGFSRRLAGVLRLKSANWYR
jgi:hypothetical protein